MSSKSNSNGISFSGLLTVVFITLKLTDTIDWSWVWVLSPLWISVGLGLLFIPVILYLNKKTNSSTPNKYFEKRLEKLRK